MIQVLSQMHLLIAAALMAASGLLAVGIAASLYFLYERIVMKLMRRNPSAEQHPDASSEKPKAAHA